MCISWTIKGLISLMHGITMKNIDVYLMRIIIYIVSKTQQSLRSWMACISFAKPYMQYPGEASEAPIHVFLFQQQMAGSVSYLS